MKRTSKKYPGVRAVKDGLKYELKYKINGILRQYRIDASSVQEAFHHKIADMAKFKRSIEEQSNAGLSRLNTSFDDVWQSLERDLLAEHQKKQ